MTTKMTKIGPYTVPSGTIVATPLFAIQNTLHNWDKPEDFRPERWLDVPVETYVYDSTTNTGGGKRGITFMPFSEGPRNCVGQVGACSRQQRSAGVGTKAWGSDQA
jgi:cytochrome P450